MWLLYAWYGVVGWANLWLAASAGWPMTLATGLAGTWLSLGMADLHAQYVSDSNVPPIPFCAVLLCGGREERLCITSTL